MGRKIFLASMATLVAVLVLVGCKDSRSVCYGVEPDGEVEKLVPCPPGWVSGQQRPIKEDEFADLEVDENGVKKKNKGTGKVSVKAPPQTTQRRVP